MSGRKRRGRAAIRLSSKNKSYLGEADILGLLTEALTAQVELVLADETSSVLADAAIAGRVSIRNLAVEKLTTSRPVEISSSVSISPFLSCRKLFCSVSLDEKGEMRDRRANIEASKVVGRK